MAQVTIAGNTTGSNIVTAATTLFYFESGDVDLTTDAGTTWIPFIQGMYLTVGSGVTVGPRNSSPDPVSLSYMVI